MKEKGCLRYVSIPADAYIHVHMYILSYLEIKLPVTLLEEITYNRNRKERVLDMYLYLRMRIFMCTGIYIYIYIYIFQAKLVE